MELHPYLYVVIGLFGLLFGSFFNVAIHRWPQEDPKKREWVKTPSHCPKCGNAIRWYDNIPVLSYIILGGKCRDCKTRISIRYPLVELATALIWLGTTWLVDHVGLSGIELDDHTLWHVVFAIIFASLYFLTVFIDFETQLIPDEITISQFVAAAAMLFICHGATISPTWISSLIGMFVLSLFFFLLYYFGGMGDGDVYLAVGFGVLFGWQVVLVVGFLGILLGGLVAIPILLRLMIQKKYKAGKHQIAFGPYLAIAAYIGLFAGHELLGWYLDLFK